MAGDRRLRRSPPDGGSARPSSLAMILISVATAACVAAPSAPASLSPIDAGPTPTVTDYQINRTAWVAGFVVTVVSAQATLDSKGGPVSVALDIANRGDTAVLEAPITLTAGDAVFELEHGEDLPVQPAGAITKVRLEFEVVGRSTIDDGVLRIGRSGEHIAAIPFRPSTGQAMTLEPETTSLELLGRAGTLHVSVRTMVRRWDLPDWHDELPADRVTLLFVYDLTYTGDFSGGSAFTADNVRLRLPDGTLVEPRPDGHSQSVALLEPSTTFHGLRSRFEIPDGLSGDFAFVIRDGSLSKAIVFTVGP
jgi:hypothetical protein